MKHNRNGRRVTYRPGKTAGVFGIIWGGIFVLIGIFVAIPHFGAFGILWTLMALAITAACLAGCGGSSRASGER